MTKIQLPNTEYNHDVDTLRLNRVKMSYFKYGSAKINFGDRIVSALGSMNKCIDKYKETRNTEYILDAMNYLMFEFMYPSIDDTYFKATDSTGSAGIEGISINEIKEISKNEINKTIV